MRLKIDQQLFLSYLVLIATLTIGVSVAADSLLRPYLLERMEADLRRELVLGREVLEISPMAPRDSLASVLGELTGRRVTIIAPDGTAVGESSLNAADTPPGDDHRIRTEVRGALEEGFGSTVRTSATVGGDHLYLAMVTDRGEVVRFAVPLAEIDAAIDGVQRRVLFVALAALILAALFSLAFAALVSRPLRRTVAVARALGAGDLSQRIHVSREDDLGDLGVALNTLAGELQRRLGQLEGERAEMQALIDSMSEGVLAVTGTGALRRANPAARRMFALGPRPEGIAPEMVSRRPEFLALVSRALRGETVPPREISGDNRSMIATAHPLPHGGAVLVFLDISELRRLEEVRKDFVANASHELKTPLTAIRGYSETLLDPDLPPELIRRFAEIVKNNSDRLQRIVDDLLDLSRIEAGGWRVDPSLVDVEALAREVWEALAGSAGDRVVDFIVDLADDHESVRADAAALRQILSNLFSNALRYTPTGGSVTIRTRPAPTTPGPRMPLAAAATIDRWTLVEVADTGSGIPGAHLNRIFERFYRADPARSREDGGTGLGLAIVKHLVEAHGGWVEAESAVGLGTTVRFILPTAGEARSSD